MVMIELWISKSGHEEQVVKQQQQQHIHRLQFGVGGGCGLHERCGEFLRILRNDLDALENFNVYIDCKYAEVKLRAFIKAQVFSMRT